MSFATTTLNPDYTEDITNDITFTTTIMPSTATPTLMDNFLAMMQEDHPEISFVIPSHHDKQQIDNMVNNKLLLDKINNTAYDTILSSFHSEHTSHKIKDSMGHIITPDQISNSAVLNMADLKNNALSGLERFFAGTDVNSLINYLWIGVVTALIVLTVIFVLFSCHFYRKFREWKKCNKDIRAHFNNDMYACDTSENPEAAYYQMESPPCYTIATGLPTYDEALHNHQEHFAFGMKFIYPTLAAVHHQASNLISSWEKYDMQSKDKNTATKNSTKSKSSQTNNNSKSSLSATTASSLTLATSMSSSTPSSLALEATSASSLLLPPPYDVAASMALLSEHHRQVTCDNVSITMPQFEAYNNTSAKTSSDLTDIITV